MKKETKGSIAAKLGAIVVFLGCIVGGGYLAYSGYEADDIRLIILGGALLVLGFFLMGILGQIIMRYEHDGGLVGLTVVDCIKAGGMVAFFAACLVFGGVGIMLWVSDGKWIFGVAGIAVLVIMIIVAIDVSIRFQTDGAEKKVKRDKNATEHFGVVTKINPRFPMFVLNKAVPLFCEYIVEVDGKKSKAFIRRGNKLFKQVAEDHKVRVLFNPDRPLNCAIIADETFAD